MIWPYPLEDYFPVTLYFFLLLWCVSSVVRIPLYLYNWWLSLTSGLPGHLPETMHHSQGHWSTSITNPPVALLSRNWGTELDAQPGLESHETRESDVGSNETKNNLCFCCVHLLRLDFLEVLLLNWQMKLRSHNQNNWGEMETSISQVFCLHSL